MMPQMYLVVALYSNGMEINYVAQCPSRDACDASISEMKVSALGGMNPDIFCSTDPKYAALAHPSVDSLKRSL